MINKYRVEVWQESTINGWIEVEAEDADDARQQVVDMDEDDILYSAEWGSCGDESSVHVGHYIEKIYEPTVSEGLWTT